MSRLPSKTRIVRPRAWPRTSPGPPASAGRRTASRGWERGRPEAAGDVDLDPGEDTAASRASCSRAASRRPCRRPGIRRQHRELVAAEPSDEGLAREAAGQPLGHLAEQLVAVGVTQRVVDVLERVEVEDADAEPASPGRSSRASSSRCSAARFGSPVNGSCRASCRNRSSSSPLRRATAACLATVCSTRTSTALEAPRVAQAVVHGEQPDRPALAEHRNHDAVPQTVAVEPGPCSRVAGVTRHQHGLAGPDDGLQGPGASAAVDGAPGAADPRCPGPARRPRRPPAPPTRTRARSPWRISRAWVRTP